MLRFKTYGATIRIGYALLPFHFSIQEIAYIDLESRFGGIYFHSDTACGVAHTSCHLANVATRVEHKVVVIAMTVFQLDVIGIDIFPDSLPGTEVEWSSTHRGNRAVGHESA